MIPLAPVRRGKDAAARIAAAETERDTALAQVRAEAGQRISAAEADRAHALAVAEQAEQAVRLALQDAASAKAAAEAASAETGRVRADADNMLASFRADAARDRDELRADLRARAERAERDADTYRDELTQLRAYTSRDSADRQGTATHQACHLVVAAVRLIAPRMQRLEPLSRMLTAVNILVKPRDRRDVQGTQISKTAAATSHPRAVSNEESVGTPNSCCR